MPNLLYPLYSLFNVLQCDIRIVLYENVLYVEVMYHFNEQVDFKISSKLIQASHIQFQCIDRIKFNIHGYLL